MTELEDLTAQLKAMTERLDVQKKDLEELKAASKQAPVAPSAEDEKKRIASLVEALNPVITAAVKTCVGDECKPLREQVERTATALQKAGYSTIPGLQRARGLAKQAEESGQPAPTFVQCPHLGCGGALIGSEVACPACGGPLEWQPGQPA